MEAKAGTEAAYEIDERMARWRQGDLALGERWFVHVGLEAQSSAPAVLTTEAAGLMVVSQTCDLVRRHTLRPFVELAPLIALDPEIWESVWRGERPSMATLSCLRAFGLAADLDRQEIHRHHQAQAWSCFANRHFSFGATRNSHSGAAWLGRAIYRTAGLVHPRKSSAE